MNDPKTIDQRFLRKLQRRVRTSYRRAEELRMDLALGHLPELCPLAREAEGALDRLDTALGGLVRKRK